MTPDAIRARVEKLERRVAEPGEWVYVTDHQLLRDAATAGRALLDALDERDRQLAALRKVAVEARRVADYLVATKSSTDVPVLRRLLEDVSALASIGQQEGTG